MARPRKYIDRMMLKELCLAQCTNDEISGALNVSWDVLTRRYGGPIKVWRRQGPMSVRRKLFNVAMSDSKGAVTAAIFYLKNYGGMADVIRDKGREIEPEGVPIPYEFRQDSTAGTDKPN